MFSRSSELSRVWICGGTAQVSTNTSLQEILYTKNGSSSRRVPCALEWAVKSTSDTNKSGTIISNINFIKGGIAQPAFSNLSSYSILGFLSAIFPYSGQDSIFSSCLLLTMHLVWNSFKHCFSSFVSKYMKLVAQWKKNKLRK